MVKFCCVCGKKGDFPNYICPDCSPPAETPEPQKTEVLVCKKCDRVCRKGRWVAELLAGSAPRSEIPSAPGKASAFKPKRFLAPSAEGILVATSTTRVPSGSGSQAQLDQAPHGSKAGKPQALASGGLTGTAETLKITVCPDCGFMRQAGYNAVIQFSGNFTGNKAEICKIIDETLERERSRGRLAAVTKVDGTHYYFNSIRAAEHVTRRVVSRFGAKLKETSKLVGYDNSKSKGKYKITFFVSLP